MRIDLSPFRVNRFNPSVLLMLAKTFYGAHTPAVPEPALWCIKAFNHTNDRRIRLANSMCKNGHAYARLFCRVCNSFKAFLVFEVAVFDVELISGRTDKLLLFRSYTNSLALKYFAFLTVFLLSVGLLCLSAVAKLGSRFRNSLSGIYASIFSSSTHLRPSDK